MINTVLVLAEGCSSTSVSATMEGLECANTLHSLRQKSFEPLFKVTTVSAEGNSVNCSGGLSISPHKKAQDIKSADLIIIPGYLFQILPALPNLSPLFPWLIEAHQKGTTLAAMCTGAFVLAEAGLLNNKIATTHWYFAENFSHRYPSVNLQINSIVTDDQNILCSGGASAGNDLLLHIIRKFASAELASECSKKLLIDSSRNEQRPYINQQFVRRHKDLQIYKVQNWLGEHYQQPLSLETLAAQFGFGTRNFIRRFKEATQQTPVQYLQALRLEKAKFLLESTKQTIETITYDVGYEDSNSFSRLFKDRVGIPPSAYRKKFQVQAP